MMHMHIVALALACSALGQSTGGGFNSDEVFPWSDIECSRFYVNPDPTIGNDSNSGAHNQPFLTVGQAVFVAAMQKPAVVVLMPGIYASGTNGEVFPIQMVDDVSLQGFAATNTVLKSGLWTSVLEFRSTGPDFEDTCVDSLTLTGGQAGVHLISQLRRMGPTISNCVMVHNTVGVKMESYWDHFAYQYPRLYPRLVNNTIVDNDCGILDIGHAGPDAGTGVASPAIINCAVLFNAPDDDLAGPDASDLSHTAMQTVDDSMIALGNQYPTTWSWTWEMTADNTFIDWNNADYRQRCGSLLVGQGTLDLSVPNGTTAAAVSPCGMDMLDYDGEGYGNPRLERGIDVGADEQGQLIVSGYMPWTTSFSGSFGGGSHSTITVHHLPDPDPGRPAVARTIVGAAQVGELPLWPSSVPGLRAAGTSPSRDLKLRGTMWIDHPSIAGMHTETVEVFCVGHVFDPLTTLPGQRNLQQIMIGLDGMSPLSNLQSFRYTP